MLFLCEWVVSACFCPFYYWHRLTHSRILFSVVSSIFLQFQSFEIFWVGSFHREKWHFQIFNVSRIISFLILMFSRNLYLMRFSIDFIKPIFQFLSSCPHPRFHSIQLHLSFSDSSGKRIAIKIESDIRIRISLDSLVVILKPFLKMFLPFLLQHHLLL